MSSYNPTDLEAYVRQRAPEVARDLRSAAQKANNEADLVAEAEKVIERFSRRFDVPVNLQRERTLVNGRADAVYNRFVIEYEPPGSLRKTNSFHHNKHAIGQVQQYMEGLERLDRHRKERLAGVVLDGHYYIFVRYRDDHWRIDDPLPVDAHSTETFLRYLLSLATELALTPENLVRDFGENSNTARQVVPTLYNALRASDDPKVKVLFQQWRRQFQEVFGYDSSNTQLDAVALARLYAVKDRNPDVEQLFFAVHTYYAAFIKVLALQIAHYYLMPKVGTGLAAVANHDTDKLRAYLIEMERGGLFTQLGIRNFLEGDFFGWYLEVWDDPLDAALRRLIGDLANYSLVTLDVDPEETRDLLKHLYQNLVPKKLRHALGEYYTPDWLAERLLNQLGYAGDPAKRILDPSCGSGTFLVLAIKRIRQYADERMLQPAQVLEQVLSNVVGFDLNPLAVISARTNYLLALGDLLSHRKGEISIPVYLADSVLTPSQGDDLYTQHGYSFQTAVGRFTVPRSLVDAHYIDQLAHLLEECVHSGTKAEQFKTRLLGTFPLKADEDEEEVNIAVALYEQLLDLEQQSVNGIWARIIKNAFAPRFVGRFDYVAGNPPWVNWESLPADYREDTVHLWHLYKLLPEDRAGARQRSARSKTDIAVLMLIVAMDKYLDEIGKLGFVITQTIFKTERGARGFRQRLVNESTSIKVEYVDDLSDIQVFEGATNRTSVLIMKKGQSTKYPVQYGHWRKRQSGTSFSTDLLLTEAMELVKVSQWIAQPISPEDNSSPWITGRKRAVESIRKVIGQSVYYDLCREGANTRGANGIFWVEKLIENPDGSVIVANMPEFGRLRVGSIQGAVENSLLYPLLRGQEATRWNINPENWIILTHVASRPSVAIQETQMQVEFPKAYSFLNHFREELKNRSRFRNFDPINGEFYQLYNVGAYTFSPYKVVWREQTDSLTCAVVGQQEGKPVIPNHKLMMLPLTDENEANFVCACMNNSPANFIVKSYSIEIQISTHVLRYIKVPRYDSLNPTHRQLASLSQQAHAATAAGDTARVQEIEAEIDQLAKQLWGLTDAELREIQESLAELG